VIGLSLGLLGGGGSILTVPVLVYVLAYPVKTAIPMSLVVVGLTSLVGVVGHARAGTVHWRAALAFGPTAVIGALAGAQLGLLVSARLQLTVFSVIMIVAAVAMWGGQALWSHGAPSEAPPTPRPLGFVGLLGGLVGTLTGLIGIGGGFLYVPALVLLAGLGMKQAVGTSLVLIVLSAAAGFARYSGEISFDWAAIAAFTALAFVGVLGGTRLVAHVSQRALRRGFAMFLLVMGAVVLLFGR
jgi:hypothetical protein